MCNKTDHAANKKRLRKAVQALPLVDGASKSESIQNQLFGLPEYQNAATVFLFLSLASEPDTQGILADCYQKNKRVAVPVMVGEEIVFSAFTEGAPLEQKQFGVLEPKAPKFILDEPDLILVPMVAFTKRKERLGHGKGFYDRYLSKHPNAVRVGLAFDHQEVDDVFVEAHDKRLDYVITETQMIHEPLAGK